jgi:anaerobic magnesium-protoporphyrin IX monomethyl ester cyclase
MGGHKNYQGSSKMKITLVQPSMKVGRREFYGVAPPLGLCYIAAVLERSGHKVNIIDGMVEGSTLYEDNFRRIGMPVVGLASRIQERDPDIIGISCMYSFMWEDVSRLSAILRDIMPDTLQVLGGFHPSALPEYSLKNSSADCVIVGEGEETFRELADSYSGSRHFSDIPGMAFKNNGSIVLNPPRPHILNLDSIPFPARHLINMEKYIQTGKAPGSQKNRRFTTMLTSRGCPNNCVFCSIKTVWGQKWRPRSPENVVNEIEELVKRYRIKEIHFIDDNISLDKKRMADICELIIGRDLDISWTTPNGVAVNTLDRELLYKMKRSGCYQLAFGIESGNEHVLRRIIRKPLSLSRTRDVIRYAKDAGIWTHGFFVIGFPGETGGMIKDTLGFAQGSGLDSAFFSIATPFPGTELYRLMFGDGMKLDDFSKLRNMDAVTGTGNFTREELVDIQKRLIRDFYMFRFRKEMRPNSILHRLKNIRSISDFRFLTGKFSRLAGIW